MVTGLFSARESRLRRRRIQLGHPNFPTTAERNPELVLQAFYKVWNDLK